MKELLACGGGISSEHLITKSVIHLLAGDGEFTIGGTPWLATGEFKAVGPASLTANCLCERHNSRLHPLDDAALFFFKSLKDGFENAVETSTAIVSGHDIERWLLKSLKAMAVSGNLAIDRKKLTGAFADDIRIVDLLENFQLWPHGTGMYCVMRTGDLAYNHNRFQVAPLTNAKGEITGLWTEMIGLSFVLVLEPSLLLQMPQLALAKFRPGAVIVAHPHTTSRIDLSWADGRSHKDAMSLKFLKNVSI
jgi:hypothetical protein